MTQDRFLTFWQDRPIEELTREELIEALEETVISYLEMQKRWLKADEDRMTDFFDARVPHKNIP